MITPGEGNLRAVDESRAVPPEHVEPTRRGRVVAAALFVLGFALVFALHLAWPLLMSHIRALPVCEQLGWFRSLVAVQALLLALAPAVLLALGLRVRRSQRWPAPGWLVLRRTLVLRGAPALRRAAWLIGAGVVVGAMVAAMVGVLLGLIADIGQRWSCG
jgi:hypothetical protein